MSFAAGDAASRVSTGNQIRIVHEGREPVSVCRFVIAGLAAGFAVHEAVGAEADVELGLAVHAELFAPAIRFRALALGADDAAYAWSRGHS